MRADRTAATGLSLALLSAATFGTSGIFARSLIEAGWSADAAVAARIGIAALVLAVPALVAMRGRWDVARRAAGTVGIFGLLAVAGAQVGFFNAVRYLPVGVALLIEYSGIVLVVLWMWAVHGQRPRGLTMAGAVAALLGLVLVLDLADAGDIDPLGVVWALAAAVGLAAYFVLSARIDAELPSVTLAAGGMAVGAVLLLVLGAVGAMPMQATFGAVEFAGNRMSWVVPVAGLSLVAAVVAYVAGIGAARVLGAAMSSFVGLTEVMFAVLFAWVALGELPTVLQAAGGGFIVAGIVLVRLDALRPSRGMSPPERDAEPAQNRETKPEHHGADVLVLELDGSLNATRRQGCQEHAAVRRLGVRRPEAVAERALVVLDGQGDELVPDADEVRNDSSEVGSHAGSYRPEPGPAGQTYQRWTDRPASRSRPGLTTSPALLKAASSRLELPTVVSTSAAICSSEVTSAATKRTPPLTAPHRSRTGRPRLPARPTPDCPR
jgi:drug/metabolite transporter (DMT)-like permease